MQTWMQYTAAVYLTDGRILAWEPIKCNSMKELSSKICQRQTTGSTEFEGDLHPLNCWQSHVIYNKYRGGDQGIGRSGFNSILHHRIKTTRMGFWFCAETPTSTYLTRPCQVTGSCPSNTEVFSPGILSGCGFRGLLDNWFWYFCNGRQISLLRVCHVFQKQQAILTHSGFVCCCFVLTIPTAEPCKGQKHHTPPWMTPQGD